MEDRFICYKCKTPMKLRAMYNRWYCPVCDKKPELIKIENKYSLQKAINGGFKND